MGAVKDNRRECRIGTIRRNVRDVGRAHEERKPPAFGRRRSREIAAFEIPGLDRPYAVPPDHFRAQARRGSQRRDVIHRRDGDIG